MGTATRGGCRGGWGRLLSVEDAAMAGTCRQGHGLAPLAEGRGTAPPFSGASMPHPSPSGEQNARELG